MAKECGQQLFISAYPRKYEGSCSSLSMWSFLKSEFLLPPPPVPTTTTATAPPPSPGSLSCAINNSLFCAVPCNWRHTQSQGHGARGACWPVASRERHWLNSRLGERILPQLEGRGGRVCLAVNCRCHLVL